VRAAGARREARTTRGNGGAHEHTASRASQPGAPRTMGITHGLAGHTSMKTAERAAGGGAQAGLRRLSPAKAAMIAAEAANEAAMTANAAPKPAAVTIQPMTAFHRAPTPYAIAK